MSIQVPKMSSSEITQLSFIVENLLEATTDKDEKVRNAIYSSLQKIGCHYPADVISSAINFRRRNPKLSNNEVRCIYHLIKVICENELRRINLQLVLVIVESACDESLKSAEAPYISADVLPVIGTIHCDEVFKYISKYMQEGVAPHAPIIFVLGQLSISNMKAFFRISQNVFKYLLSILPVTKTDNMRKTYAITISQMVESIVEQTSAEETSVVKESYSTIVEEIFDALVTSWLQIKDLKICEIIFQAAGSLVLLFSDQKLMNDAPRIVNTFLAMYKKSNSIPKFVITQAISNFLSVVPRSALQSSLDPLLSALHNMVWVLPDFTQPLTVKNHSEVLRCYDYLGSLFEDKLYEVLLRNLRSSSEQDRVVSLIVTSHLFNSSEKLLRSQISEIIAVLRGLLDESSYRINRGLGKIIIALAYRECLAEKDAVFIEFLAKHCHHNATSPDLDELESMCRSTINLFSTSIPSVQPLCWKVLLHMLMNGDNFQAVATFAKSLAFLVSNCDHAILEKNCYERSETVFVRVMSLLGSPLHEKRGIYLLNFLQDYILWKVKINPVIWKVEITQLLTYLENSDWEESEWEMKLLNALSASFIDDTKPWLGAVNAEILKLLTQYQSNNDLTHATSANSIIHDERAFLYKLLALLTDYIDDENVINTNVEKILFPVNQRSLLDLKACSRSVGILSKNHFDLVYKHLESHQKTQRKPNKLFSFLKDSKSEAEVEIVRRMVCDCFTAILTDTPSSKLLPKLKQLLLWLISVMQATRDSQTRNSCTEALYRVSEIMLKNENEFEEVEESKNILITFISSLIELEKSMPSVSCLKTINMLFKLSVCNNAPEKLQLVQKCLNKLFQYYSVSNSTSAITETGVIDSDPIIQQLSLAITETVRIANSSVLDEVVIFLQPWLSHRIINHRIISMYLLKSVLVCYIDCYFNDVKNSIKLGNVSSLLGRVYIRTFEANKELSSLASDCVCLLLTISEAYLDNANISAEDIKKNVSTFKPTNMEAFRVTTYCKLSPEQLLHFAENLVGGLLDSESSCSLGTAHMLQAIFTEVGAQFQRQALDIFNSMLLKLAKLESDEIQSAVIGAILALAHHHKDMFLNTMLNQSLPFHYTVGKCWSKIAENEIFSHEILKRLLETIMHNPTPEPNSKKSKIDIVNPRPIVAVAALKELVVSLNTADTVISYFPDLFSSVLMLIPYYMGQKIHNTEKAVKDPVLGFSPARLAFDTLCALMEQANCKHVRENLTPFADKINFKKSDQTNVYYDMVKELAKIISYFNCDLVVKVLVSLSAYTDQSRTDGQRGTVTIFYVEIFNSKCSEDVNLVDTIITSLLNLLNDPSALVREHCIKGLAAISNLEFSLVELYKERILLALNQGLDDNEATTQPGIVMQSLLGLSKLLPFLNDKKYASLLSTLGVRIKQFFEKDDVEIRRLSLKLFGEIVTLSNVDSSTFSDQVYRNLVCLFFHLGEKEVSIVQTCKFSLRAVSHLVDSEKLRSMIDKHLIDDGNLNHQSYIPKIAEIMAEELPRYAHDYLITAISYMKSIWSEIRATSAIFIGIMYQHQNEELRSKLPVETVSAKLLILLRDQDSSVRACAAMAMGTLLNSPDSTPNETAEEQ